MSLFLHQKKLLSLLDTSSDSRLWAIDGCSNSTAKCFVWSSDLLPFLDIYLDLPRCNRHAYEIIRPLTPCLMVYDLDMCLIGGLNSNRNHSDMMNLIGEFHVFY